MIKSSAVRLFQYKRSIRCTARAHDYRNDAQSPYTLYRKYTVINCFYYKRLLLEIAKPGDVEFIMISMRFTYHGDNFSYNPFGF